MSRPTHLRPVIPFIYRAITFFGRSFQSLLLNISELYGLFPVRSPLLRESRLISFPPGTEMFQFPGFAFCSYVFRTEYLASEVGFPIRTPPDHKLFAVSPELFAGYHVLLRLLLPRHPPYALSYLAISSKLTLI